MYYQVVSLSVVDFFEYFKTLKSAKQFVLKYCPKDHAVIRHFNGRRKVTRITSYYPSFGFETKSIKQITEEYNKSLV